MSDETGGRDAPLFYVLCSCCDEGLSNFDEVFQAESKESVLTYILKEIKSYVRWAKGGKHAKGENHTMEIPTKYTKGRLYYRILCSADWNPKVNGQCIGFDLKYNTDAERKKAQQQFILKASIHDLKAIIDNSYVDGDSSFQIRLIPIKEHIVL